MIRRYLKYKNVKSVINNVTVEPLFFLHILSLEIKSLAVKNLELDKACRVNIKFNDTVCSVVLDHSVLNTSYIDEREEIQRLVAYMSVWTTVIESSIPALLILFIGGWSDRWNRRKPFLLSPVFGEFITVIALIINTVFFNQLSMEVAGLSGSIFLALSGGTISLYVSAFSYVAENSNIKSRTLRIGVLYSCILCSRIIGTSLSGIFLKRYGYYGVFSIAGVLLFLALVQGYFFIEENQKSSVSKDDSNITSKFCETIKDFLDVSHVSESFNVFMKQSSNSRRTRLILLFVIALLIVGPKSGEMTVLYLFARFRFNWDEVDFSIFSTYSMVTNLIGTLLSVVVFSHILKIDDALIGVMSCMSKILAGFVYAFATTAWMIYLAPLVDIVNGTSFIAMRSIVSKLVPTDELGKINSMIGLAESVVPVIYGPMYSAVYAATMETMPGTFFLLGGALTFPAVLIFLWMYGQHKGDKKRQKVENGEKNTINNISSKLTGIDNAAFVAV